MPLNRMRSARLLCRTSMVSPSRTETRGPVKSVANAEAAKRLTNVTNRTPPMAESQGEQAVTKPSCVLSCSPKLIQPDSKRPSKSAKKGYFPRYPLLGRSGGLLAEYHCHL